MGSVTPSGGSLTEGAVLDCPVPIPASRRLELRMSERAYVEQHDGGYRIEGTRVSLDSIVYAFLNGQTAESIAQSFPVLSLEQVYGAIAFYLAHRSQIDDYLTQGRNEFERQYEASRSIDPEFYRKLEDLRLRRIA